MLCVDNLFKISCISQFVFVFKVGKEVFVKVEKLKEMFKDIRDSIKNEWFVQYWIEDWMERVKIYFLWLVFDDNMK